MGVIQVQDGMFRPHNFGPGCWCQPIEDEEYWIHRHVDVRPDYQPRMCAFSS